MRGVVTWVGRRLRRDNTWSLDPQMPLRAVFAMLRDTFGKALRGQVRRVGLRDARGLLLLGRNVTLRNKSYISLGCNFIAEDYSEIQGLSRRGIVIGNRVTLGRFAMIRPTGYYGTELGEGLRVGDHSSIGPYSFVGCSGFVEIGRNVMIAPRVSIYAENHNFEDLDRPIKEQGVTRSSVTIEDDCWIASHSVILAGVKIGRGAIVAAGSVVTRDVPPYAVVGGAPARIIRSRRPDDTVETYSGRATQSGTHHP